MQRVVTVTAVGTVVVVVVVRVHHGHVVVDVVAQDGICVTLTALRWDALLAGRGARFTAGG